MKAVLFDIGSTLVTGPGSGVAKRLAARLGLDKAAKDALNTALMTTPFRTPEAVTQHMLSLDLGQPEATVRTAVFDLWNSQLGEAHLIEGARESLAAWAQTGATLCLVSNIWMPYQLSALEALGPDLDRWVPRHHRFYSYEIEAAKPSPVPFQKAIAAAQCAPSDAVMVGDSYREDIAPAMALGLKAVWILRRADREAENIQAVINGDARKPDRAIAGIHEFMPNVITPALRAAA